MQKYEGVSRSNWIRRWIMIGVLVVSPLAATPSLAQQVLPKPGNDDFADARAIQSLPFDEDVNMNGASSEPGETHPCVNESSSTVWYRFQPAMGTDVVFKLTDSFYGAIFEGTSLSNLSLVRCTFYGGNFYAVPGHTYYLQATYYGSEEFVYEHDAVKHVHAEAVGAISGIVTDSVSGSPIEGIRVAPSKPYANSPEWVTQADGTFRLSLEAGDYTLRFDDYSPEGIYYHGRQLYFTAYFGGSSYQTATKIHVTKGETHSGVAQELVKGARIVGKVLAPPINAIGQALLPPQNVQRAYVTAYRTSDGQPSLSSQTQYDGAFVIGPLMPGSYKVRFNQTDSYQTEWFDDKPDFASAESISLSAGDEFQADATLEEVPVAANDNIASAFEATSLPYFDQSTLSKSTIEPGEPLTCRSGETPMTQTIWYKFRPTERVRLTAEVDWSPTLAVYSSPDVGGAGPLVQLACSYRPYPYYDDIDSHLNFEAQPGFVYYFQAGRTALPGAAGGTVRFTLRREDAPVNDLRASASLINSMPFDSGHFTTLGAGFGPDDAQSTCLDAPNYTVPTPPSTVWFQYSPAEASLLSARNVTNWTETAISVWREVGTSGIGAIDLIQVACGVDSTVRFTSEPGVTYLIQIASPYSALNYRPDLRLLIDST